MPLTLEQVVELAPDAAAVAAGKKLMGFKNWQALGRGPEALWGLCQGSATYQVKVDLTHFGYHCSCPSRKFPCKHVLGLLLIDADSPAAVPDAAPPDWAEAWLAKRRERDEKKGQRASSPADEPKPVDEKPQARRAAQRDERVRDGVARLDLWLADLFRSGLAGLETRPASFWTDQARRLVDAQRPAYRPR